MGMYSDGVIQAHYLRRVVPGRVQFGCQYTGQLANPEASEMAVGGEFSLRQSKVSASLNSAGKVDSSVEVKLGTFPTLPMTLSLTGQLDHAENKSRFGFGLSVGQ
ncbi:unnamed protein product [Discosporangium mesarthrocarpum]